MNKLTKAQEKRFDEKFTESWNVYSENWLENNPGTKQRRNSGLKEGVELKELKQYLADELALQNDLCACGGIKWYESNFCKDCI